MRDNLSRLGTGLSAAFALVALALTYWQVVAATGLNADPANPRVLEAERRTLRRAILDRNGQPLAVTVPGGAAAAREYPAPGAAAITGYHSQRFGSTELEAAFDSELRGAARAGAVQELRERLLHAPVVGSDLVTTIDVRIQAAAVGQLGGRAGAIVVLDPRSGAVLALASSPAFDPAAIDHEFSALRDDPASPLLNRATQAAYDPGSTFKLVTAAAALDLSLVDLARPFACTTAVNLGGQTVDCRNNNPPVPRPTYKQAFAWSSNRTFALTGLLLGFPGPINPWLDDHPPGPYPWTHEPIDASARALERYAGRFGFEQEIPFDLAVRPSHLKSAGTPWSIGLLASTAFGQGELSVTPFQMALAVASIANDGKLPRPYLVSALRSPRGAVTSVAQGGGWIGEVMSAAAAQTLRDFLVEGVEHGYASKAHLDGVQVGGKTGTAEVGPGQAPHAWFIGLAPADAPRLVIAVVFEHGGSGSDVATPAGREVLRVALDAYPP